MQWFHFVSGLYPATIRAPLHSHARWNKHRRKGSFGGKLNPSQYVNIFNALFKFKEYFNLRLKIRMQNNRFYQN